MCDIPAALTPKGEGRCSGVALRLTSRGVSSTFDVVLTRGQSGLGFDINPQNVVSRVVNDSPAQHQGEMHVGDRIVAVDGTMLDGQTHLTAVMDFARNTYVFTICRRSQSPAELDAITADVMDTIKLKKVADGEESPSESVSYVSYKGRVQGLPIRLERVPKAPSSAEGLQSLSEEGGSSPAASPREDQLFAAMNSLLAGQSACTPAGDEAEDSSSLTSSLVKAVAREVEVGEGTALGSAEACLSRPPASVDASECTAPSMPDLPPDLDSAASGGARPSLMTQLLDGNMTQRLRRLDIRKLSATPSEVEAAAAAAAADTAADAAAEMKRAAEAERAAAAGQVAAERAAAAAVVEGALASSERSGVGPPPLLGSSACARIHSQLAFSAGVIAFICEKVAHCLQGGAPKAARSPPAGTVVW